MTANVNKSRNRIFGFILGKLGVTPEGIQSQAIIEGVQSARAMSAKSQLLGVDTPIIDFVDACFEDPTGIREYVARLIRISQPLSFKDG